MRRRRNFLYGRSGSDALSMATSFLACGLLVIAMFVGDALSGILWILACICLILTYFRIFSRNVAKRRLENERFLKLIRPITDVRARRAAKKRQKNLYCFFKCPQCSTVLRVPKGKGHIRITCRTCGNVFERNS